jgi:hypothetical protein
LMSLQHQLSVEVNEPFNSRLSRIVSKLFMRVLKAEEGVHQPFCPVHFDLEAIVCLMDDLLESPAMTGVSTDTCREMVEALTQSIVRAHGSAFLLQLIDELGIDFETSALALSVASIEHADAGDAQVEAPFEAPQAPLRPPPFPSPTNKGQSRDVATLVSTLGSASQGPDRDISLEALRNYVALYGDEDLNAHLQQLSAPFRAFIEGQLDDHDRLDKAVVETKGNSMSDRLRNLRSRLEATEMAVHTAVDDPGRIEPSSSLPLKSTLPTTTQRRVSGLTRPSPSKRPAAPASSLRERLASPQESNAFSSSMGRAAALRARLEDLKKSNG